MDVGSKEEGRRGFLAKIKNLGRSKNLSVWYTEQQVGAVTIVFLEFRREVSGLGYFVNHDKRDRN